VERSTRRVTVAIPVLPSINRIRSQRHVHITAPRGKSPNPSHCYKPLVSALPSADRRQAARLPRLRAGGVLWRSDAPTSRQTGQPRARNFLVFRRPPRVSGVAKNGYSPTPADTNQQPVSFHLTATCASLRHCCLPKSMSPRVRVVAVATKRWIERSHQTCNPRTPTFCAACCSLACCRRFVAERPQRMCTSMWVVWLRSRCARHCTWVS
jgi:hypothetical protein